MVQEPPDRTQPRRVEEEMRASYLDYAMSVIVSRALPDARDGLKPVQRRILFGMQELGVTATGGYKKAARMVGDVMGKFHPHGDSAIYDALVRMAQDFSMRYPLVSGQGNFGSIDGDPPAAMRYTEARLAPIAMELLAEIDRNTVDFYPNFDESLTQPWVLPARLPNLLLNGSSGIAVGMATNIPPHNLNEICDAVVMVLENPECTVDDLLTLVQGPDFPTAAMIFNRAEVRDAYINGRGRVTMQARMEVEEAARSGRSQIVVTELPYQVNKATLLERIAELVRSKKIEGISDLRDESDRHGIRMVIELSRGATYAAVKNQLLKHTALRSSFAVNMLALVDGQPETLSLKRALEVFIGHRREVIRRRSEFDLEKARERAHILEGLLKALDALDLVIKTIRESASAEAAKSALMALPVVLPARLIEAHPLAAEGALPGLSDRQAQAVLDMQLRRLAQLESSRILEEYGELMTFIAYLVDLLAHPEKIDALIKEDCADLKTKFGDARRTQVFHGAVDDIADEDLIGHQQVVVTVSERGYTKRVPLEVYRSQARGGRGKRGQTVREEDFIRHLLVCDTHDQLLMFTAGGKVYALKSYEVPEASREARGIPVANVVDVAPDDRVTAVVAVADFSRDSMVLATERGEVKRTPLAEFESVRRNGLIAMRLEDGDSLVEARPARETSDAILVSSDGQAIRFTVGSLRVASRTSGGVRGMTLRGDAVVIAMAVDEDGDDLLVVSERGQGKRTPIEEYPRKGRGGQGVQTFRVTPKTGKISVARMVSAAQELVLVSEQGIVLRTSAGSISQQGRATQGVQVMRPASDDDRVSSVARVDIAEGIVEGADDGADAGADIGADAEGAPAETAGA